MLRDTFKLGRQHGPFVAFVLITGALITACAEPRIVRTTPRPPAASTMAQFWVDEPIESRDLFWGPGGRALAPKNGSTFTFEEEKVGGFSPGLTVEDDEGREWSAKQGPEAQTEVVASRLYWAVGYRQPPTYYVAEWTVKDGPAPGAQPAARFRPDIGKVEGDWSLHQNPFVGTQAYRGLLVLNVLLNNWDVKDAQNKIYEFDEPRDGVRRWYVARDLGATFGRPRWPDGTRNNPDDFEAHPFILGYEGDSPRFADQGRHDELLRQLRRRDVWWMSKRLSRLSDRQLADAFRAAGYPDATASRFIARLEEKIAEGLSACARGC